MVKKTNTTKSTQTTATAQALNLSNYTMEDFKNAALIVSVFLNAFVFTAWLIMQVTDRYNATMISFLVR